MNEVIDVKCMGCKHVNPDDLRCTKYQYPGSKWRTGNCPLATHVKQAAIVPERKVNPIKASKRGGK